MLQTLDGIISVVFVFLMFSLVVSAAREVVAAWLHLRSKTLRAGLDTVLKNLGDQKLVDAFWSHPFVKAVQTSGDTPSYIPSANVAAALLHIAAGNTPGEAVDVTKLKTTLTSLPQKDLATIIALAIEQGGTNATLVQVQASLEKWVDGSMERISSLYQRKTRTWLFLISLLAATTMNVDTVTIWQHVQNDKSLRDSLVAQAAKANFPENIQKVMADQVNSSEIKNASKKAAAEVSLIAGETNHTDKSKTIESPTPASGATNGAPSELAATTKQYRENLNAFTSLDLPIGWDEAALAQYSSPGQYLLHIFGILASACAASLGAPFWFDLLQRFMNIRSVIKPLPATAKPDSR